MKKILNIQFLLNMVEKLFNNIKKELNKHEIGASCVLASYLFNQCVPNSDIFKRFLIGGNYYCLHVWNKYNNKIYDVAPMQKEKL